ncbi:MAG: cell division protein ZapA [Chitinispirillia bacterium]|nr:cell division protein ZapA [Chitinispirillia bacterium]MCL2242717.1 cell division protein ZapA [Chitinispirillia bacterium]
MGSESVRVRIFNLDFVLKSETDAETTKQVAQYVNARIAELQTLTASSDNVKVAVLSALNIAGELFETKAKYEAEAKKVQAYEEKIKSITGKIGAEKGGG